MKFCSIGKDLAARRKSLSVTQDVIARLAGVSLHTVCNLESESGNPTLRSLVAVADVLGLDVVLKVKNAKIEEEVAG